MNLQLDRAIIVKDNNIEGALRILNKKMKRDGKFNELKRRRCHIKPSLIRHKQKQRIDWLNELKRKEYAEIKKHKNE